jgi:iron complex outermembrane recepter protein
MFKLGRAFSIVCAALTFLIAMPVLGQATGKISGTVRDANGSPLGGAAISITNQATGATRIARTSAAGSYDVWNLETGTYVVAADVQGFRKATQVIHLTAVATADFSLEIKVSEAVTVTAMKREEAIEDVPFSVAAPTEEVMRERGIQNLEQIADNVANFSVQNLGPGQSTVAIRGMSSGQIARDQPGVKESVGSYLDESVISLSLFNPDLDLFDMNRVEVLRGPQGTLFGSGSEAGTVRYITNQPELGQTKFFGEFAANSIDGGNQGGYAKAGFNTPLGSNAALRVSTYYDRWAGYTDAVQPDFSIKKNENTGDTWGLRLAVDIAPTDRLTITPRFIYNDVSMDGWNREDIFNILANPYTTTRPPVTLHEHQIFTQIDEPFTDKFYMGDIDVKYQLGGGMTLTSITSYTHRDILVVRDAGALTASITGGSIGLPESVYTLNAPLDDATKAQGWTEEVRVNGGNDKLKWVGGGFYADLRREYGQNLLVAGFEEMTGIPTKGEFAPKDVLFFSALNYDLRQWALFGEATYSFSPKFAFTTGLRYYNYKEDKSQVFDGLFGADANGKPQSQPGSVSADGVAPRFIANYTPTPDENLYAQASKGFRLGGVNDPLNVTLCTPQDLITFGGRENWKDEVAWNYEIGSKTKLFGGRGSFNISAFYVDIKDLQVTVTAGSCSSRLIFNVPKARSVGSEIEFAATPTDRFDVAASMGFNNAQLRSTVTSTAPDGTVSIVSGIESGKRLPSVPQFQAALSATYTQPLSSDIRGYINGNYQHVGARFTQVGDNLLGTLNLNSFGANTIGGPLTQSTFIYNAELPSYDIVNLRLGIRQSNWDIAFYVNNLNNETALLGLDQERGTRARIGYLTNQPRTFGLSSRVDF